MDQNDNNRNGNRCALCGRTEEDAGKMVYMPGNLCLCPDCMQKMMDTASHFDFSSMMNNPMFNPFAGPQNTSAPGQSASSEKDQAAVAVPEKTAAEDLPDEEDTAEEKEEKKESKRPQVSFLNLGDIFGGGGFGPSRPKVKKKKKDGPRRFRSFEAQSQEKEKGRAQTRLLH